MGHSFAPFATCLPSGTLTFIFWPALTGATPMFSGAFTVPSGLLSWTAIQPSCAAVTLSTVMVLSAPNAWSFATIIGVLVWAAVTMMGIMTTWPSTVTG